ncbi:MAG: YfiR family protein [Magnetococcales bacterium]|nr:YfiR family protein [Magnetococcales bacterium]
MNRLPRIVLLWSFLPMLLGSASDGWGDAPSESQVKVAYLYQFTKFVTWPESAFPHAQSPFQLCLLGDASLQPLLAPLRKKSVQGHPIDILFPDEAGKATQCHLLYIAQAEGQPIPELLEAVRDNPVLTIADDPDFNALGGMIRFLRFKEHLRFAIRTEPARRAGLTIHATLLEVSHENR